MSLPADYHTHTPLCRHAEGEPVELAAQAVKLGLTEMGFSDHAPMPRDDFDDWRMKASDLEAYVGKVEHARRAYPHLAIKLALEVDYLPGCEAWVRGLAGRFPWDYLIGSVHYVSDSWALDSPFQLAEWKKRDPFEVWTAYFERLKEAVESGLFDIVGHLDLCKKFCFYPQQDWMPLVEGVLVAVQRRGLAIELNTSGLRKDCKEIYPSNRILNQAAKMGVHVTFGSDAHAPREVGWEFEQAVASAKLAGFTHWRRFSKRHSEAVEL